MNDTNTNINTTLHLPGYKAFNITILLVCLISSILCVITIAAMTLPLFYRRRRKKYSTYNLYLVYLAIPELIFNILIVYIVLTFTSWTTQTQTPTQTPANVNTETEPETETNENESNLWLFDHSFDYIVFFVCQTANLYTNAFLTFEIFMLLKNSNIRKRHVPPTIAKVTKQAMISYGVGILAILTIYLGSKYLSLSTPIKNYLFLGFSLICMAIIPLSFLIVICMKIYCQGLVRSTGSMYNGRLRVLFYFFLRIVLTDILIWLPSTTFYVVWWISPELSPETKTRVLAYNAYLLLSGCKGIVNFGCALTKPDARKLIVNVLKWVCCHYKYNDAGGDNENERPSAVRFGDPYLKASSNASTLPKVSVQQQSMIQASFESSGGSRSEYNIPGTSIKGEREGLTFEQSMQVQETETALDGQPQSGMTSVSIGFDDPAFDPRNRESESDGTAHVSTSTDTATNVAETETASENITIKE